MARVTEMVKSVARRTDYDPDTDEFRDTVVEFFNDEQQTLFAARRWLFAERETTIPLHADETIASGITTASDAHVQTLAAFFDERMEGHILDIGGVEHTIVAVTSAASAHVEPVPAATAGSLTFTVKYRFTTLPQDLDTVIMAGAMTIGNGVFQPWNRRDVEEQLLQPDVTGAPRIWWPAQPTDIQGLVRAPTVVPTATGTTLATGDYEMVMTLKKYGVYSARSTPASFTLDGSNRKFTVTFPIMPDGTRMALWLKPPGFKAFRLLEDNILWGAASKVYTDLNTVALDQWEFQDRMPENDGLYQRLRVYPRQASDTTMTVRYIYRPSFLIEDSDTPEFPRKYHTYLVFLAISDILYKLDETKGKARKFSRDAAVVMRRMEQRHTANETGPLYKGSFEGAQPRFFYELSTLNNVTV